MKVHEIYQLRTWGQVALSAIESAFSIAAQTGDKEKTAAALHTAGIEFKAMVEKIARVEEEVRREA